MTKLIRLMSTENKLSFKSIVLASINRHPFTPPMLTPLSVSLGEGPILLPTVYSALPIIQIGTRFFFLADWNKIGLAETVSGHQYSSAHEEIPTKDIFYSLFTGSTSLAMTLCQMNLNCNMRNILYYNILSKRHA